MYRGRNYNPHTRPRYPLMLWKPATPVYPKLVQQAPEGLTVEEAAEMRRRGQILLPILKLGMICCVGLKIRILHHRSGFLRHSTEVNPGTCLVVKPTKTGQLFFSLLFFLLLCFQLYMFPAY